MRSAQLPVVFGIAAAMVFVAPSAEASPSARLVYVRGAGAEACPDEATLRGAVKQRLGYDQIGRAHV